MLGSLRSNATQYDPQPPISGRLLWGSIVVCKFVNIVIVYSPLVSFINQAIENYFTGFQLVEPRRLLFNLLARSSLFFALFTTSVTAFAAALVPPR